jgi:hypothetical protein
MTEALIPKAPLRLGRLYMPPGLFEKVDAEYRIHDTGCRMQIPGIGFGPRDSVSGPRPWRHEG